MREAIRSALFPNVFSDSDCQLFHICLVGHEAGLSIVAAYQATAYNPYFHSFDAQTMSRNLPSIDRRIIELLLKPENVTFCVQSLRDQYIEQYDVNPVHKAPMRRFIYERVKKLIKAQFVEKDSEIKSRGQKYHVSSMLIEADLGTNEDDFVSWLQRTHPQAPDEPVINYASQSNSEENRQAVNAPAGSYTVLEKKLNEAQSRFLESLGEVEAFQQLMRDHPELNNSLSIDYRSAHERSSRLLGHVSALEKAISRLSGS